MSNLDNAARDAMIAQHIGTPAGRVKLAGAMVQPLRTQRDYTSVARKALQVEQLPDGALPMYDKDPDVAAYVIGEQGDNIVSIVNGERVLYPLFEIASNPEIAMSEIRQRRFDVVQRVVDKAKAEIQYVEDRYTFALMDQMAAGSTNPNAPINVVGNLTAPALSDAFANIQRHDIQVSMIFMNALDYGDLRKWDRDTLSPMQQDVLFKAGILATVWGAKVMTSRAVPQGTVYVCGEPEFFGRMPVRQELTVLSADEPRQRTIGFSCWEQVGIGLFNPKALQVLKISRV